MAYHVPRSKPRPELIPQFRKTLKKMHHRGTFDFSKLRKKLRPFFKTNYFGRKGCYSFFLSSKMTNEGVSAVYIDHTETHVLLRVTSSVNCRFAVYNIWVRDNKDFLHKVVNVHNLFSFPSC